LNTCEVVACELLAEWNVRTGRGENIDVCTAHKDELVETLIGLADVTRL
jgi:hypothetical protein